MSSHDDLKLASEIQGRAINEAHETRLLCRHNLVKDTIGRAGKYLQANLIVIPPTYAPHFKDLCVSRGLYSYPDFDVRTDFPRYCIQVGGRVIATKTNILDEWTEDHVAFLIGVRDVHDPDFGDEQTFKEGEVPVFWACEVTPQLAIEAAGDRINGTVMTHDPSFVLVTDWTVDDLPKLSACLKMELL